MFYQIGNRPPHSPRSRAALLTHFRFYWQIREKRINNNWQLQNTRTNLAAACQPVRKTTNSCGLCGSTYVCVCVCVCLCMCVIKVGFLLNEAEASLEIYARQYAATTAGREKKNIIYNKSWNFIARKKLVLCGQSFECVSPSWCVCVCDKLRARQSHRNLI